MIIGSPFESNTGSCHLSNCNFGLPSSSNTGTFIVPLCNKVIMSIYRDKTAY